MRGEEVVGAYFILFGLFDIPTYGFSAVFLVQVAMGAAFLIPKSQRASDALRLTLFGLLLLQIAFALYAGLSGELWLHLLGTLLAAGGLAALLLEGMSGRKAILPVSVALIGESIRWFANR